MLTNMSLAGAGFNQSPRLVDLAGLLQRASIVTGFAWITALSARALKLCNQPKSTHLHHDGLDCGHSDRLRAHPLT
jgi:hypothetical protein